MSSNSRPSDRMDGSNDPPAATPALPSRSLNKSASAPNQGSFSWLSRLRHKIRKSLSALDSSSRDRAALSTGARQPQAGPSQAGQNADGAGSHAARLPEDAAAKLPATWRTLKKYVSGIFKPNEQRQEHENVAATAGAEDLQGSQPAAQPLPPSGEPGEFDSQPDTTATPRGQDVLPELKPAGTATRMLVKSDHLPHGMDRPIWCIEDYLHLQKIHSGHTSSVYQAICRHTRQTVALKVYQPDLLHKISQHQLLRETRLHAQLSHPNIIKLYAAFQQEDGVVLVQESADGGDLLQFLARSGARLSERRAVRLVIAPLLQALYYLHSKAIIHRDIKLENILLMGQEPTLKLADFGLCLNQREERAVTRAGTLDYMAPEVLRCPSKVEPSDNKDRVELAYGCAADIYAVGVLAYELLNGVPPFTRATREDTERLIMKGSPPPFLVHASDDSKDFIYACLTKKAQHRPSAWQLQRYPWVRNSLRPGSSQRSRGAGSRRPVIQDAAVAVPQPAAARASLAARTHPARALKRFEPTIQEEMLEERSSRTSNVTLPNAMPGSSSRAAAAAAQVPAIPLASTIAGMERVQLQSARSWHLAARVPARPPPTAPVERLAAPGLAAAPDGPPAAQPGTSEPEITAAAPEPSAQEQGDAGAAEVERSSWQSSVKYTEVMAADRRSGRQLQHQLAGLCESASSKGAEAGTSRAASRAMEEQDMSVDAAWLARSVDLERAFSDLSRHTTDAGYRSGS